MDRLILLRHGKAEANAASGKDFDRALTERGRQDTALVARALADAGLKPDLVLVSPAARTTQTWDAAAPFFPGAKVESAPALYDISAAEILALAKGEAGAVMVIGHNPGLGQLAAWLSQEDTSGEDRPRMAEGFPTAAAAVIGFDPPSFALYTPKALGGGA